NANYLDGALAEIPGISPLETDRRVTRHARHLYSVRYDATRFGNHARAEFIAAMHAEGVPCISAGYVPLTQSPAIHRALHDLFGPESVADIAQCHRADEAGEQVLWITQNALLGDQEDMDSIATAIEKIQAAWR
ncbi:MAG TPA: DegT/DnrJ/EryC1/StrS family aminotransferase, partial [Gemmatimonadaceae bacterium]